MAKEPTVEDLKCCGNCQKGMEIRKGEGFICISADEPIDSKDWCYGWIFDGLSKKRRYNEMFTKESIDRLERIQNGTPGR
jgi:hypothetical protein